MKDIKNILSKIGDKTKYTDAQLISFDIRSQKAKQRNPHLYDEMWVKSMFESWVKSKQPWRQFCESKNIPTKSFRQSLKRFGFEYPKNVAYKLREKRGSTYQLGHEGLRKSKKIEDKVKDIKKGMKAKEYSEKWGVSKTSFYTLKKRYEL
jgi:hypothetical protein